MKAQHVLAACLALLAPMLSGAGRSDLQRGRYLVAVGSCNDCHTERYAASGGSLPEAQWLTGRRLGFKGPWGTTYAPNLRLLVQGMSEEQWMQRVDKPARPPMPWFSLKAMTDSDRRDIYRYILSLGPAGTPAPAYVAPGRPTVTPYEDLTTRYANCRGMW